jgi:hypothetical protein
MEITAVRTEIRSSGMEITAVRGTEIRSVRYRDNSCQVRRSGSGLSAMEIRAVRYGGQEFQVWRSQLSGTEIRAVRYEDQEFQVW